MSLLESNRVVSFGLVVLIWLVQTIIYPAFADLAREGFRDWHNRYTAAITRVVAPLMLAQVILTGWLVATRPRPATIAYAVLVVATWVLTAVVAVPIHNALGANGQDAALIRRLVRTNWLRTAAWSLAFVALLFA